MATLVTDSGRRAPARLAGSAILACQSDERLVELVRQGHERAFEAIVARYRNPLMRFSTRFLPESRTEDAVQQALINAHSALVAGDEPVQLKPWLYAITRNAALNMVRQNGWNHEQIPADFDGVRRPDQVVEQRAQLERTVAAVNELPDRQRDALVMREFEGRSYSEIGLALGANDGAVRQLLNRARGALRAAATALMPPPLVERVASMPPSDGRRVSELLSGLGAAGVAKAGATALVAGSLVVGAVKAPLPLVGDSHRTTRQKATLTTEDHPTKAAADRQPARVTNAVDLAQSNALPVAPTHSGNASRHRSSGASHSGPGGGEAEHRRSVEHRESESNGRSPSGSGEHHSGSDDRSEPGSGSSPTREQARSDGTDDSSGSSGASGSGSGDVTTPSDGSGTSGSGPSGSGTSGSGDGSSGSTETSASGSSDSVSSGSSGSSGSNSHDSLSSDSSSTDD